MDPVGRPRRLTRADVPRLTDRFRAVRRGGPSDRSAGEHAVSIVECLLLLTISALIAGASGGFGLKMVEWMVAVLVIGTVCTAIQVRIRFRGRRGTAGRPGNGARRSMISYGWSAKGPSSSSMPAC